MTAIHDDPGYQAVREALAAQYNLGNREPDIQVYSVDVRGDRSITLRHNRNSRKPLNKDTDEVLRHIHQLWGFDVRLESLQNNEVAETYYCPPRESDSAA